jgi:hypothetical protein
MFPEQDKPKRIKTGRPAGWHWMAEFVDKDGTVYHKGKEQPKLKGTLPPTKVVPKKKTKRRKTGRDLKAGIFTPTGGTGRGAEGLTEKDMRSIQSGLQSGTGQLDTSGIDLSNIGSGVDLSGGESISRDDQASSNIGGEIGASAGAFGGIGDFKQGGLAKRKVKPKKMKRGGLASKK